MTALDAPHALARALRSTRWAYAMCLQYVADAFSNGTLPYHGIGDAIAGWNATRARRYDRTPPAGVPVYWTSPKQPHGHVAISRGGGIVRSTDWPTRGLVGDVSIQRLEQAWGLHYLGWGLDFCGDAIANVYPPAPPAPVLRRGTTGAVVTHLQRELLRVFPAYAGRIAANGGPNGIYGPATEAVVRDFQHRVAIGSDGIVGPATWAKLAGFGIKPA